MAAWDPHDVSVAAHRLVVALDHVTGGVWRTSTLGKGADGDEVERAWDALIEALEGKARGL